jgi:4-hydroxy-tetrahydrodipicolinate reductase
VIGTSGLTDADYEDIDSAARAKNVGVIAAGNFSITAVLLQKFAVIAAQHLPQWEIIEYNSPAKPDAPSGTTRELLYRLSKAKKVPVSEYPVERTSGLKEARGATVNGTQVHSVRLAGFVSSSEIIFGGDHERLRITQEAGNSAEPYVTGTLLAARKVGSIVGLVRGLENFLEI